MTPNRKRAILKRVSMALAHYADPDSAVRDLLADLRHYCDAYAIDFAEEDRAAYENYRAELAA